MSKEKAYTIRGMVSAKMKGESLRELMDSWGARYGGYPDSFETDEGEEGGIIGQCESCRAPITDADSYYQWGGEDPVETCMDCGGHDESHVPVHPKETPDGDS